MLWIHHSRNGRSNWIVRILYELTQPAKWCFWKLYHCACFCWRGTPSTFSGQVPWRSRDKSHLTKWRETSTGVWFFQSEDLWKLFPETLKQKMRPVFSCQVGGDVRRPDHAPEGSCAALLGATYGAVPPGLRWGPQPPRQDVCMGGCVSKWPPDQHPAGWEAVFSKHVQGCSFLGQGVLALQQS